MCYWLCFCIYDCRAWTAFGSLSTGNCFENSYYGHSINGSSLEVVWKYNFQTCCNFHTMAIVMEIVWICYGFSGAIANFIVWISQFFQWLAQRQLSFYKMRLWKFQETVQFITKAPCEISLTFLVIVYCSLLPGSILHTCTSNLPFEPSLSIQYLLLSCRYFLSVITNDWQASYGSLRTKLYHVNPILHSKLSLDLLNDYCHDFPPTCVVFPGRVIPNARLDWQAFYGYVRTERGCVSSYPHTGDTDYKHTVNHCRLEQLQLYVGALLYFRYLVMLRNS